jgi:hypothetical protein
MKLAAACIVIGLYVAGLWSLAMRLENWLYLRQQRRKEE